MAKHLIFLLHGMGEFEKNWSGKIQTLLKDSFKNYPKVAQQGLIEQFEFVEITYDDEFESWRQQWKKDAEKAAAAAKLLGLDSGIASQLIDLAKSPTGDSFFQTHLLDVVMYRYIKGLSETVSQSVRKQILERLKAAPQNDVPSWSVIAHSMGTAVIHDTLHAMFTQPVDGEMLGDSFMPYYIFMVANVSKLLWNKGGSCTTAG
jgi:hypothetical protein